MRLALVHGFTQTGASWAPVAPVLTAAGHEVLTPDAPGHGTARDAPVELHAGGQWLADRIGRSTWIGYSMGGRYCLHLALDRPDAVDRLVLVSTTAGVDDPSDRDARRRADRRQADAIEAEGVDAFLERWLDNPLFATLPRDRAGLGARRSNTAEGLAASLRSAGTGTQEPLWGRLHDLEMPVLIVTGGEDRKFTAIGERLAEGIPGATLVTLAGLGHAAPWEDPAAFAGAVNAWLSQ